MNKKTAVKQHSLNIALACAFALGATALSGTALAANSATATATTTVVTPIALAKSADLVFGSIIASGTAGTVAVNTNGTRSVTGGVTAASSGATPTAAKFDVTGAFNFTYAITYPATVTLASGGNTMIMTQYSDLTGGGGASATIPTGTLNASGTQSIFYGGSLAVAANQAAGAYTANIPVSVDYN